MKRTLYWDMIYSASRRKHHHRCFCCRKIVKDGDAVFMWRATNTTTRVMHAECCDVPTVAVHANDPKTMRELAIVQCKEHFK